jgi:hypothetical protein
MYTPHFSDSITILLRRSARNATQGVAADHSSGPGICVAHDPAMRLGIWLVPRMNA